MQRSTSFILRKATDRECLASFHWCILKYGIRILVEIADDYEPDWSSCGALIPITYISVCDAFFSRLSCLTPRLVQPVYAFEFSRSTWRAPIAPVLNMREKTQTSCITRKITRFATVCFFLGICLRASFGRDTPSMWRNVFGEYLPRLSRVCWRIVPRAHLEDRSLWL